MSPVLKIIIYVAVFSLLLIGSSLVWLVWPATDPEHPSHKGDVQGPSEHMCFTEDQRKETAGDLPVDAYSLVIGALLTLLVTRIYLYAAAHARNIWHRWILRQDDTRPPYAGNQLEKDPCENDEVPRIPKIGKECNITNIFPKEITLNVNFDKRKASRRNSLAESTETESRSRAEQMKEHLQMNRCGQTSAGVLINKVESLMPGGGTLLPLESISGAEAGQQVTQVPHNEPQNGFADVAYSTDVGSDTKVMKLCTPDEDFEDNGGEAVAAKQTTEYVPTSTPALSPVYSRNTTRDRIAASIHRRACSTGAVGNTTPGAVGNVTLGAVGNTTLGGAGNTTPGAVGNVTLGAVGDTTPGAAGNVTLGAVGNTTLGAVGNVTLGAVGNTTPGGFGDTTPGAVGNTTFGGAGNTTLGAVGNTTPGGFGNTTLGAVGNTTPGTVGNTTPGTVGNTTPGTVGNTTLGAVGNTTPGTVGNTILGGVSNTILGAVGNMTVAADDVQHCTIVRAKSTVILGKLDSNVESVAMDLKNSSGAISTQMRTFGKIGHYREIEADHVFWPDFHQSTASHSDSQSQESRECKNENNMESGSSENDKPIIEKLPEPVECESGFGIPAEETVDNRTPHNNYFY